MATHYNTNVDYKPEENPTFPEQSSKLDDHGTDSGLPAEQNDFVDPLIGITLDNRYQIVRLLARGGMATVYYAIDLRLERNVAIKVMHPHLLDSASCAARFQQEAKAVARLIHPNIVTVFDQGRVHGTAYIVMELVEGSSVRDKLQSQGPFSLGEALNLIKSVVQGLDAAHRSGIVHRDIKPENILLTSDGTAKIADFGLAKTVSEVSMSRHSTILGTVAYVPPEVVVTGESDSRGDLYSLGVMLYELITGTTPFTGASAINIAYSHVHQSIPLPSSKLPWLPTEVDELVSALTAREVEERIDSASNALEQINLVYSSLPKEILERRAEIATTDKETTHNQTVALSSPEATIPIPKFFTAPIEVPVGAADIQSKQNTAAIPLGALKQKSSKRTFPWAWISVFAIFLILIASASALWWYHALGPGAYAVMPTVEGMSESDALQQIKEVGFTVETESGFSDTVPQGNIISSTPEAGVKHQKSVPVEIRVSAGIEMLTVPKLVGESIDNAKETLLNLHFQDPHVESAWSETVPKNTIISANLNKGEIVKHDTPIKLVVSKGRQPFKIPDLAGKPKSIISENKLDDIYSIEIKEEYSDKVPADQIISQDPAAGETRYRGDKVKLTISKGPELVEIPRLFGLRTETAKKRLEDAGFKVKINRFSGGLLNLVRYATPAQGTKAPKGSTVTLTIF